MCFLTLLRFDHCVSFYIVVDALLSIFFDGGISVSIGLQLAEGPWESHSLKRFGMIVIMPIEEILLTMLLSGQFVLKISLFVALLNFLYELEMIFPEGFDYLG